MHHERQIALLSDRASAVKWRQAMRSDRMAVDPRFDAEDEVAVAVEHAATKIDIAEIEVDVLAGRRGQTDGGDVE
jgi:hypothetical protein